MRWWRSRRRRSRRVGRLFVAQREVVGGACLRCLRWNSRRRIQDLRRRNQHTRLSPALLAWGPGAWAKPGACWIDTPPCLHTDNPLQPGTDPNSTIAELVAWMAEPVELDSPALLEQGILVHRIPLHRIPRWRRTERLALARTRMSLQRCWLAHRPLVVDLACEQQGVLERHALIHHMQHRRCHIPGLKQSVDGMAFLVVRLSWELAIPVMEHCLRYRPRRRLVQRQSIDGRAVAAVAAEVEQVLGIVGVVDE